MKNFFLLLSLSFLMTSCLVVKVYEAPTNDENPPKLLREKRSFISSGMTVPVPNKGTEVLFIGEDHPPIPMPLDETHLSFMNNDSTAQKKRVVIRIDSEKEGDFNWISSQKGQPSTFLFVAKDSLSMKCDPSHMNDSLGTKACCAAKDPMKKQIHIMKGEATGSSSANVFVMKSEEGESPLIVIDGEVQDEAAMKALSPDDIATIDVLKGDSATKAYGEKGANGVIKIRLKKN